MNQETITELRTALESVLAGVEHSFESSRGDATLTIGQSDLLSVMKSLRDSTATDFTMLMDVTAVDQPRRERRFDVVYHLLSMTQNMRLRVKISATEDVPVPSVADLWPTANWFEREVWDMYGLFFSDHPDLRRLLTDYGFDGHPLRKDFPLTGYAEVRYDPEQQRVVYEPVKLAQEFRTFNYDSPWEGMTRLPGDEKAESDDQADEAAEASNG